MSRSEEQAASTTGAQLIADSLEAQACACDDDELREAAKIIRKSAAYPALYEALKDLLKDYASSLTVSGFSEADIERLPTVRRVRAALAKAADHGGAGNG